MSDEKYQLLPLLKNDDRYPLDAYRFVKDGLDYAVEILDFNHADISGETDVTKVLDDDDSERLFERHLTGQQLCEALRLYAQHQYGFMARVVLANWGICETSDFGNVVYNMINVGMMKKSADDQRSHFDNVYDFDEAFENRFEIKQPAGVFWPG
jgi:uncharacterized repeat protein (TIGR04138 family)